MSPNKQVVHSYMAAFDRLDHAAVLALLTDDVEWVVPGMYSARGKAAFGEHMENDAFTGFPGIVVTRLVEEGDRAASALRFPTAPSSALSSATCSSCGAASSSASRRI